MNIERNEKYIKVTAEDGYFLTNYQDGDILNFNSCRIMYCPKTVDLSDLREITEEENNKYNELKEEKEKEIYGV